jgi:cardiolipin synthase
MVEEWGKMKEKIQKDYTNKVITIPNILSFFRLCLIPVIVWLYCVKKEYFWTIIVYGFSSLTDIVDGIIARKFNMISTFGKVFDPVADKLTQMAIIICLAIHFGWYMLIPLAIFVVKEVGMNVVGLIAAKKTGKIKGAMWHGKLNTVLFFVIMVVHLLWYNMPPVVSYVFVSISVTMMLISATIYTVDYVNMLKEAKNAEK